jgi:hypothetical protein
MKIAKKDMTADILRQFLNYDPISGHMTWATKHCSKVIVGRRAGSISPYGHRVINLFGSIYPEHRLAWLHMTGVFPAKFLDHVDHNEQNNAFSNLREVSHKENNVNNSLRCDNKSGHIGIRVNKLFYRDTYQVDINFGEARLCKAFKTIEKAIAARDAFYRIHNFHVNHGISKPT